MERSTDMNSPSLSSRHPTALRLRRLCPVLAAALVPVVLLTGLYAARGVAPFGPNSLFFGDMDGQYSHFLADFSELFGRGAVLHLAQGSGRRGPQLGRLLSVQPF